MRLFNSMKTQRLALAGAVVLAAMTAGCSSSPLRSSMYDAGIMPASYEASAEAAGEDEACRQHNPGPRRETAWNGAAADCKPAQK